MMPAELVCLAKADMEVWDALCHSSSRLVFQECRKENKQHWEQLKREAEGYKLRRQNMHQRMVDAHASRVARGLAGQWPAQYGVTKQDIVAVSCFVASISFLGWFWTGKSVERVVAPAEPQP